MSTTTYKLKFKYKYKGKIRIPTKEETIGLLIHNSLDENNIYTEKIVFSLKKRDDEIRQLNHFVQSMIRQREFKYNFSLVEYKNLTILGEEHE